MQSFYDSIYHRFTATAISTSIHVFIGVLYLKLVLYIITLYICASYIFCQSFFFVTQPQYANLMIDGFQVGDLLEASKKFNTLSSIVDFDLKNKTVRSQGSHTRNLRRVRQGLDLIRELFQNFLSDEYVFLPTYMVFQRISSNKMIPLM